MNSMNNMWLINANEFDVQTCSMLDGIVGAYLAIPTVWNQEHQENPSSSGYVPPFSSTFNFQYFKSKTVLHTFKQDDDGFYIVVR